MSKKPEEHGGEKVPIWIISFADMITLLLSFFVMLQTMAKSQDATLFGVSQDSFRRAIAGLGIPDVLFGKQTVPQFNYHKLKYPTEESGENMPTPRVIDADDEQIRKLFDDISKQMDTRTSQSDEELSQLTVMPLKFAGDWPQLDEAGKRSVAQLADNLKQHMGPADTRIYVIGLNDEAPSPKQKWILSTRGAVSAADALRAALSGSGKCDWAISAWGAGAERFASVGRPAGSSSVVFAVMKVKLASADAVGLDSHSQP